MATQQFVCANWSAVQNDCKKTARYSCKSCLLVAYCGPECQKAQWPEHKTACKSPLGKETWHPAWVLENRKPLWVADDVMAQFGTTKYLWGNMPAIDVLQLKANEGLDEKSSGDLNLLFAASGDLRNVVKTISDVPKDDDRKIEVTLNDRDFDIVARNIILLLIALDTEDVGQAVDCIIHVWYSAVIRQSDMDLLRDRVRPRIEEVCNKIKDKGPQSVLRKSWQFGQCTLTVMLQKASWERLLTLFEVPPSLTLERENSIRRAVTLAPSRQDYRDRYLVCQSSPAHRLSFQRFKEDGIVLPFGSPRDEFRIPNPTIYDDADTWPMMDNADPLTGWSLQEIRNTSSGPAAADMYGKLFYYLRSVVRGFVERLKTQSHVFQMLHMDAETLPAFLGGAKFSRIEVSNISDAGYLGVHKTIFHMVPLLQPPSQNPHATLITLFMNAVPEAETKQDELQSMTEASTRRLYQFLAPKKRPLSGGYDPQVIRLLCARSLMNSYDHIFARYMTALRFREAADVIGAAVKDAHTVVPQWPGRLKLRHGQAGAQEEFDARLAGGLSGKERYLEWKRTREDQG